MNIFWFTEFNYVKQESLTTLTISRCLSVYNINLTVWIWSYKISCVQHNG